MEWAGWIERFGEPALLAAGGLGVGLFFGFLAQRSRFCLRAAVIEFWRGQPGEKLAVWLLTFSAAVVTVQALLSEHYDPGYLQSMRRNFSLFPQAQTLSPSLNLSTPRPTISMHRLWL